MNKALWLSAISMLERASRLPKRTLRVADSQQLWAFSFGCNSGCGAVSTATASGTASAPPEAPISVAFAGNHSRPVQSGNADQTTAPGVELGCSGPVLDHGMIAADFLGDPTGIRIGHALPKRTDSRKLWACAPSGREWSSP